MGTSFLLRLVFCRTANYNVWKDAKVQPLWQEEPLHYAMFKKYSVAKATKFKKLLQNFASNIKGPLSGLTISNN